MPEYVWACTERCIVLPCADDLIQRATDDSFDDAYDQMSNGDVVALDAAIKAFNESHSVVEWNIDYSRRVVLAKETVNVG